MKAWDVECPHCGAEPGKPCKTIEGKSRVVEHLKRQLRAEHLNEGEARPTYAEAVRAGL